MNRLYTSDQKNLASRIAGENVKEDEGEKRKGKREGKGGKEKCTCPNSFLDLPMLPNPRTLAAFY